MANPVCLFQFTTIRQEVSRAKKKKKKNARDKGSRNHLTIHYTREQQILTSGDQWSFLPTVHHCGSLPVTSSLWVLLYWLDEIHWSAINPFCYNNQKKCRCKSNEFSCICVYVVLPVERVRCSFRRASEHVSFGAGIRHTLSPRLQTYPRTCFLRTGAFGSEESTVNMRYLCSLLLYY